MFYLKLLADGSIPTLLGGKFNFLTVSIDLGGCSTQIDIIRKIGRGLKASLQSREAVRQAASGFWNWITNWEVLGVRYHKDQSSLDPEEVCEELANQLNQLCNAAIQNLDGVFILIDEADRPPSDAGLGELLKLMTERLSREGCNNVLFGLAALPVILSRLRDSHESSPRIFHNMLLDALKTDEKKRVVNISLAIANDKNDMKTIISDNGIAFLADLSEGYPHFLQQFSYSAFEIDADGIITVDDVSTGAFAEGGALAQLGDKFFNEMYHARISSEDYRRVLDAMADHGDEWISRKEIIVESGVGETNVNNAFQALKAKQIILQDDTRRGFYRLPTRSFAAWINAIRSARANQEASSTADF